GRTPSSLRLEARGHAPIAAAIAPGRRWLGQTLPSDGSFRGAELVTHMHWDHVQGLRFFGPILAPGAKLDVYGPSQEVGSLADAFRQFGRPPFFPVTAEGLYGQIEVPGVDDGDIEIDGAKVRVRPVPHVGANNGYRVEVGGATVAYIADHQMPHDGSHRVSDDVLELCDGADLVIHDAQYTVEEFAQKYHW